MAQAINQGLRDAMTDDDRVLVFGEDVSRLGGVFRVTDGLRDQFGTDRCFDTPLAEANIIGMSVGLAMKGFRPVPEIQFDGFVYPAFEQIVSHLAKMRNRTKGAFAMPVTVRLPSFGGIGAIEHHSESPESYFVHTAGLKVVVPANPDDAYSMLRESIAGADPVIFLEPKSLYWSKSETDLPVTTEPIGAARVVRPGNQVTVVAYGNTVVTALGAAEEAHGSGIDVEVIDLRSLVPLDTATIVESVKRTGRCVVVHEAARTLGMGAEIAAVVQEEAFYHLEAPVLRATGFDTPYPPPRLEKYWLPDRDRVLDRIDAVMSH